MFFIHGGRFEEGSAGIPLYDGSLMANTHNVVVVTINYRIGVLGFLATSDIEGQFGV
jgi:carboxylesterase type B